LTPAASSLRLRILSPAIGVVIVTAGKVSATVTLWVASADELPLASVTWADTVAVPLASASASVEGIVALQLVGAAFPAAVLQLLSPLLVPVTWKVLLAAIPVTVPVRLTPAAASLRLRILSPAIVVLIATVGTVSSTLSLHDALPI